MADDDALEVVRLRNNFYRDNYRRVVLALLLMILINIGLVAIITYQITQRPTPQYFATSSDGKIIPLYALSQPIITTNELLQWSAQAAVASYTYGFATYRKDLQAASEYYTTDGWKEFMAGLERSRNLELVISRKLSVTAVATGAPIVTDQGVINGRYAWKMQIPILVNYESAGYKQRQALVVNMVITRVSTLEKPKGIAIASFYSAERPVAN